MCVCVCVHMHAHVCSVFPNKFRKLHCSSFLLQARILYIYIMLALNRLCLSKRSCLLQWNLHIPDTVGTQTECPDYRGVLISEVKVKCYVFIQIKALYNLITLFFIKTYERMTKSYTSIEIFINMCLFSRHKLFHLHFSNSINCYTYAIGFRGIFR